MLDRTDDLSLQVEGWLAQFEHALAGAGKLTSLFHPGSFWRDVLALSWTIKTLNGADAILRELPADATRATPRGFAITPNRAPPRRVTRTQVPNGSVWWAAVMARGS